MSTIFPQLPTAATGEPFGGAPAEPGTSTEVLVPTGPPDALAATYRVPRVDLLPREIITGRRFRRTQQRSVVALVAVVGALSGGFVLAVQDADAAAEELVAAQARTAALQAEQAKYARAPQVYAQVDAAEGALRTAMADDVRWYTHLADLSVTAPDGVWLTTLTASVDPAAGATADPLAAPGAAPTIGTITIGGTVRQEPQVADWLEVLDATPGLASASASTIARTEARAQEVLTFESTATVTADALSHRFEQETD